MFYEGSSFGEELVTGHRVTIREGIVAGRNLLIGTLCDFMGNSQIGDYVKAYNNVHICRGLSSSKILSGSFRMLCSPTILIPPARGYTSAQLIRRHAVVATHACVMPGIEIGEDSLVGAAALVTRMTFLRTQFVGGVPAKVLSAEPIRSSSETTAVTVHIHGGGTFIAVIPTT